jgi:hypothetical protein
MSESKITLPSSWVPSSASSSGSSCIAKRVRISIIRHGGMITKTYRRCATIAVPSRSYTVPIAQGYAPWSKSPIIFSIERLPVGVERDIGLQSFTILVVREQTNSYREVFFLRKLDGHGAAEKRHPVQWIRKLTTDRYGDAGYVQGSKLIAKE